MDRFAFAKLTRETCPTEQEVMRRMCEAFKNRPASRPRNRVRELAPLLIGVALGLLLLVSLLRTPVKIRGHQTPVVSSPTGAV
jgi:hypothetical protein